MKAALFKIRERYHKRQQIVGFVTQRLL